MTSEPPFIQTLEADPSARLSSAVAGMTVDIVDLLIVVLRSLSIIMYGVMLDLSKAAAKRSRRVVVRRRAFDHHPPEAWAAP